MKRNLFAAFLAVMLVMALMFVVAPDAKAEDTLAFQKLTKNSTLEITEDTLLDLNGFNATVNVAKDVTLSVIDSGNNTKAGTTAGVLTKTGEGTLAPFTQDPSTFDFPDSVTIALRFVAIENVDESGNKNGTYSFHPCNLTFSQAGLNTKAGDDDKQVALCLRATYFGNDKVVSETTEFGICPVVDGKPVLDPEQHYSANSAYDFAQDAIITHAFFNLTGALDKMDTAGVYCAYMKIGGTTVYSSNFSVTPRDVLKKINEKKPTPSAAQKEAIEALMRSNTRVNNILSNLRPEIAENTLVFDANKANRKEFSTEKQVWFASGVTFTNDKEKSNNNVADYGNPVRCYQDSTITVEAAGMTKIVFNCNKAEYTTNLKASLESADITYTADGNVVTVEFATAANTFTVTLSGGQVRLDSIVVTAVPPSCTHEVHNAKCTEAGTCSDCDEPVAATGHTGGTATCMAQRVCSKCGQSYGDVDTNNHKFENNGHTCDYGCGTTTGNCTDADTNGSCDYCGGKVEQGGTTDPENPGTVDPSWTKTDLGKIKSTDIVVIVWTTNNGTSYAISNNNGASSAPSAVAVAVTVDGNTLTGVKNGDKIGDIDDTIQWNITNSNGSLTIYPNGTTATWLYCTNSNNGVRVGTNTSKEFTIDSSSGYLKHKSTNRYLGVYIDNPDVRCYTGTTGNIANQTLAFYVCSSSTAGGETPDTPACEHTNTTTTTVDATCTAAGSKTVTCDDCGETVSTEEIAALGHTTENGVCDNCGDTIGGSTEPETPVDPPVEEPTEEPKWTLLTDVNDLKAEAQIVIVAKNANFAMSTTQNSNNRAQATVTKDGNFITLGSDVQILTLEAGKTSGTWAFYTGTGYLYAASSSKNYLKTEVALSANSSWSISVDSSGVATIKATGTNTRNWLRYNSSNNPPLFSCYSSGQTDVAIYILK